MQIPTHAYLKLRTFMALSSYASGFAANFPMPVPPDDEPVVGLEIYNHEFMEVLVSLIRLACETDGAPIAGLLSDHVAKAIAKEADRQLKDEQRRQKAGEGAVPFTHDWKRVRSALHEAWVFLAMSQFQLEPLFNAELNTKSPDLLLAGKAFLECKDIYAVGLSPASLSIRLRKEFSLACDQCDVAEPNRDLHIIVIDVPRPAVEMMLSWDAEVQLAFARDTFRKSDEEPAMDARWAQTFLTCTDCPTSDSFPLNWKPLFFPPLFGKIPFYPACAHNALNRSFEQMYGRLPDGYDRVPEHASISS